MMREKKNGTPTSAVMMPIGKMTPGMIDFETIEVTESSSAPASTEPGRKKRWSSPRIMRAMCGPTRPTKPMVPTKLTGHGGEQRDEQHGLEPDVARR